MARQEAPDESSVSREIADGLNINAIADNFHSPPFNSLGRLIEAFAKDSPFIALTAGGFFGLLKAFAQMNEVADINNDQIIGAEILASIFVPYIVAVATRAVSREHLSFLRY